MDPCPAAARCRRRRRRIPARAPALPTGPGPRPPRANAPAARGRPPAWARPATRPPRPGAAAVRFPDRPEARAAAHCRSAGAWLSASAGMRLRRRRRRGSGSGMRASARASTDGRAIVGRAPSQARDDTATYRRVHCAPHFPEAGASRTCMSADATPPDFSDFALPAPMLRALQDVGYESPSPIQAATIPPLLQGRDVLGQAQTGTGKTAAFALPALARLDPGARHPQVLVLAPTRELAIQVAEAFQKYATHLPGFQVLPIYGGQGYGPQLAALRRGVQVIVGTPGRVIDHLERGSLDLSQLRTLVLDEADEMLRMGFIDDVEA